MNKNSNTFLTNLVTFGEVMTTGGIPQYVNRLRQAGYITISNSYVDQWVGLSRYIWTLTPKGQSFVNHPSFL